MCGSGVRTVAREGMSCMGYRSVSKAAFELGSVLSWDNGVLDLGQLWKMRRM